ncbi:MAG: DinB family protein [Candidatus Dormibacteraeota bacterium]|nr:DinB family protein [Candidatus Dormibacteraeota bacterium]
MSNPRSAQFAEQFEAAHDEFIGLIESLTVEQWHLHGKNFPRRIDEEDEGRPVGVIAHHVATNGDWIMQRIQTMLAGGPLSPVNMRVINSEHAREHADVAKGEVLRLLRASRVRIADAVRAIPDNQLDVQRETPVGPMSAAQRVENVLIGHMKQHQGSIQAATA